MANSYPYNFAEWPTPNGSYGDIQHVQMLIESFKIEPDEAGSPRQMHFWLINSSREIDAVLLKRGYTIPPPADALIMPILANTAALGAMAQFDFARYETGEDDINKRANAIQASYDNMLGLLERGDIDGLLMGMSNAGWATQANRTKYYHSGNLEPQSDGTAKKPVFTMNMQW